MQKAMIDLSGGGFKLWCYINKNKDGYQFELSMEAAKAWGITKSTYYRAKEELEEKKYLVPEKEGSSVLIFYEMPQSQNGKKDESQNGNSQNETSQSQNGTEFSQNGTEFSQNE